MKIDQNTHLPNLLADAVAASTVKEGARVQQTRAPKASAAPVLPTIQGDFDAERVNRIRDDISAGRYAINTSKIADGLLATVRDLVGNRS